MSKVINCTYVATLVLLFHIIHVIKYADCQNVTQRPTCDVKVEELQGWKDEKPGCGYGIVPPTPQNCAGYIALATSLDSTTCLNQCGLTKGCRYVSYNLQTGSCDGFSRAAKTNFSRDVSYTLLAHSAKSMTIKPATDYSGGDIPLANGSIGYVGTWSENICMRLCRIHPQCNVATYSIATGTCFLKTKTLLNPTIDPTGISYIS
jgi:hypothetical protein